MKSKERFPVKLGLYTLGLCFYAWFVCLMTRAAAGISPITSFPYLLTEITGLTLGTTQLIVNSLLVLLQVTLMGKEFDKRQLLQLVASLGFSVFIDVLMPSTAFLSAGGKGLPMQIAVFLLAMLGMAIGLSLMSMCKLILLPGDGLAQVLAYKLKWEFGQAKVLGDCLFVSSTIVVSLLVLHRIVGIQWGTVVAAVGLGQIVRRVSRVLAPVYQRLVVAESDG